MTSEAAPQDFAGRVAIVTGAARGLGRATAARLRERGAVVAVHVRDLARAEAVASDLGGRRLHHRRLARHQRRRLDDVESA